MNPKRPHPETVLITGASSGIGEAMARAYAAEGRTLLLTGRNAERLAGVAASCRDAGGVVHSAIADVADRDGMRELLNRWDREHGIDLVVANAGIAGGDHRGQALDVVDEETVRDIFAINMAGVLNTVMPLVDPMCRRGQGQIAIMSSLAGFRGMPSAPAYGASKAAVRSWGEGLRGRLAPHGVAVNVICPGFVVSRITDANSFRMPMLMEADRAARIIKRELARNTARIAFPWPMYAAVWLINAMPVSWSDWLLSKLPDKG